MDRKSNLRDVQPSLSGGTQTVMGKTPAPAAKDSLIGTNTVKEYVPGTLPKGTGTKGGRGQRN